MCKILNNKKKKSTVIDQQKINIDMLHEFLFKEPESYPDIIFDFTNKSHRNSSNTRLDCSSTGCLSWSVTVLSPFLTKFTNTQGIRKMDLCYGIP